MTIALILNGVCFAEQKVGIFFSFLDVEDPSVSPCVQRLEVFLLRRMRLLHQVLQPSRLAQKDSQGNFSSSEI